MRSLRIGAGLAPLAVLLAAAAAPAQQMHPTYFGWPGQGTTGPVYKYQHPWTNSIFGYRTCRTESDEQARFERERMIAYGQQVAAFNRLHFPKQPGYLDPNGVAPMAHVNGNYGQGFGATEQQECSQAQIRGAARLAGQLPCMAKHAVGSTIHAVGRAWKQGQLVGCGYEGDHYGVCNGCWQNGGVGFKALASIPGKVVGGLKQGLGHGCGKCGGGGCASCGGGEGGGCASGSCGGAGGGCTSCGGQDGGCASCRGGKGLLGHGGGLCRGCGGKGCGTCGGKGLAPLGARLNGLGAGMGMPGAGPGGAFGGPMPPYYSAYPGMNREDALRYVEGFQYYPPNQIIRSPREFFMWGERYGLGK